MSTLILNFIKQTLVGCLDNYNIFEENQFKKTRKKEKRFIHLDDTLPKDDLKYSEFSNFLNEKNGFSYDPYNYREETRFHKRKMHTRIDNDFTNISENKTYILFGFLEVNMSLPFSPKDGTCYVSQYFQELLESFKYDKVDYYSLNWIVNEINRYFDLQKNKMYEHPITNKREYEQPFEFYTIEDIEKILFFYKGINFDFLDKYTPYIPDYEIITNIDINIHEVYLIYLSKLINYIKIRANLNIPDKYVSHKILFIKKKEIQSLQYHSMKSIIALILIMEKIVTTIMFAKTDIVKKTIIQKGFVQGTRKLLMR